MMILLLSSAAGGMLSILCFIFTILARTHRAHVFLLALSALFAAYSIGALVVVTVHGFLHLH